MNRLLPAFLMALLLLSCRKEPPQEPEVKWTVSAVGADGIPTLPMQASYESLTVQLTGPSEGTQVHLSSSASWLKVRLDVLAADGIVPLETKANDSGQRREASIVFTDASHPERSASLTVVQLSGAETQNNGEDAIEVLYVGYGYDVYKALDNPMSLRTTAPVLDYYRMLESGGTGVYEVVQDCHLSRTETKYVASSDIHAYGENLTRLQTGDSENEIAGCRENCIDAVSFTDPAFGSLEQQNFGYGVLEKAVAARVVDKGALMDLRRRNQTPYSTAFADCMRAIRLARTASRRQELIEQTLLDYGTHVVIQVDLGGRLEYTFTMTKEGTFQTYEDMVKQINYTLGQSDGTDILSNAQVSSSKSVEGAITVKGGSPATRAVLESDIRGLGAGGQIDPSHVTDWLSSINHSQTPERDPNLEVIHFELFPIWDLVYPEMRQEFLDAALQMASRSDCATPASMMGTEIYEITTSRQDLFDFSSASDQGSLCRILYLDGTPLLEVCREYIPKIRTDQPVTVAYPIYYQHIRLNQGIFIGDGVHRPAYVGFSGENCYVQPFEDLTPGTVLDRFWYVNGNLMLSSPSSAKGPSGNNWTVRDDYFYYVYGSLETTPIVKVGAQFWTRKDVPHNMGFTKDPNSRKTTTNEYVVDGVLYTRFYYDIGYYPRRNNAWIWGYQPNTQFEGDPNTRWYLPSSDDIMALYSYLGFNPKALFKGQASGFNAGFNGYYGMYDLIEGKSFDDGANRVRYAGQFSMLASRPLEDVEGDFVVVLDKDYHFSFYKATGDFDNEFYPVRPVRGYMFEYPLLKTIEENTF